MGLLSLPLARIVGLCYKDKPHSPKNNSRSITTNLVMNLFLIKRILIIAMFLLSSTACAPVFENRSDIMARKALFDLIKAQETYRAKHNTYTKELAKLLNYNLKYNNGIVYLEIQLAGKHEYRAISLPAESTTARVFVYDTSKGGFYEADEVEVSKYVLGALNFIRGEKEKQKINIFLATILLGFLVILGLRFTSSYNGEGNNNALASYFISLFPLGWAVAALNHLTSDIVFSSQTTILSLTAITLSLASIFITSRWLKNRNPLVIPAPVLGLAGCTLLISITSAGVVVYTLYKYYPV